MESLRAYLKGRPLEEQEAFADRCGTTIGYLRKVLSTGGQLGESIVIAIDRESDGAVPCEELRPDVDWAYLRGTSPPGSRKEARTGTSS